MKLFLAATCAALMIGSAASAATVNPVVYATSVTVGTTTTTTAANNANRQNAGNAIGSSDATQVGNTFKGLYSLGIGGSADFGFGTNFGGSSTIFEVTGGNRANLAEAVKVSAFNVATSMWDALGRFTIGTSTGPLILAIQVPLQPGKVYSALRLTDDSRAGSGDGFDVDSVSVSAVPLPAAGLLLLAGLAGLGAMRRRQSAIAA